MDRVGIEAWLKKYKVSNYIIIEDLSVDVNGGVDLSFKGLVEIPVRFGVVSGNFDCSANKLTSLVGCPTSVGGSFSCFWNRLVSLEGCPVKIGGSFDCNSNKLIDSEVFLYEYDSEQICQYYKNKKLNKDLKKNSSKDINVETKKKNKL